MTTQDAIAIETRRYLAACAAGNRRLARIRLRAIDRLRYPYRTR